MKRILTLSVILALLLTLMVPIQGFAQDDRDLENAISTAKRVLDISDDYDIFNYSIYKNETKTIFNLMWSDTANKLGEVNASIDSDGMILSYHSYKPDNTRRDFPRIPRVSREDALKTSREFINRANPSLKESVEYQDDNTPMNINDSSYHFRYVRVENGIPFPQDSMSISVDNRTGRVQSFYCSWADDLVFPEIDNVLSLEEAQHTYEEKLSLKLTYRLSAGDDPKPYLVYTNVFNNNSIDAKTGDIVSQSYNYYGANTEKAKLAEAAGDMYRVNQAASLTPVEKKAVENVSNFIKEAKAEEIGRKTLNLDSGFKLNSINLYSMGWNSNDYVWSMHFVKEETEVEGSKFYSASVSVDAATGDITSFYKSIPSDTDATVIYDKNEALKIAGDFIESMQPEKSDETEYTTWDEPLVMPLGDSKQPRQYYFTYTRKANSAYFIDNGFTVTVDTVTGSVISYDFRWYKGQLPGIGDIITLSNAHEILFEAIGLHLQYITCYKPAVVDKVMPIPSQGIPQVKLVYALKPGNPSNIDAISGELVDYQGRPYDGKMIASYSDIEGCPEEDQIKQLAQYGISLPGSEFKPNWEMTHREFLYLLAKTMDFYMDFNPADDNNDELYDYLMNTGIVKDGERTPDWALTRSDAVKFIIRALHYDNIANLNGIYKLPFKDEGIIASDIYGYAALAYGLGIIEEEEGCFNPNRTLTKANGAELIYNILSID